MRGSRDVFTGGSLRKLAAFFPLIVVCACVAALSGLIFRYAAYLSLRIEFPRARLDSLAAEASKALMDSFRSAAVYAAPLFSAGVNRGVAVRLTAETGDRACLAYWYGVTDAPAAVRSAAYTARGDPRYRPIEESEIPELTLELSVFGRFVPARDPFDFQPGAETLMVVENGDPTLIQAGVMTDLGMSKPGYVRALCRKAGMKEDAWESEDLLWYRAPTVRFVRPVEGAAGK